MSLILDCAVGPAMETADMCLVGAEGVMENGGIINKVSCSMCLFHHMHDESSL